MQQLINLIAFLEPYGTQSYLVMFGILLACGFGFPMPEDIVLISGGILSARGVCDFWATQWVCFAGVMVGDGIVFTLGRVLGPRVKQTFVFRRIMKEETDAKVAEVFRKYGDKVVFMGRFMPGLRMPIFMTAGIYRVTPLKFFALDGFAAIISVPVWIYVGYFFGSNLEELERRMTHLQFGLYGILGTVLLIFVAVVLIKRRRRQQSA